MSTESYSNSGLMQHCPYTSYKRFLWKMLQGARRVLKPHGVAVFVIGDVADPGKDPLPLAAHIWQDVGSETGLRLIELVEDHLPVRNKVSRIWGETKGQATARDCALVLARDDGEPYIGPETIDWEEPYKDGGPDAAHARLDNMRFAS
jgi:SAM-dependent methyltransferase